MLKAKELAIRAREAKKKEKGTPGGIRIVLPSVPADPLLKPGQKPRPLRLLSLSPLLVHYMKLRLTSSFETGLDPTDW